MRGPSHAVRRDLALGLAGFVIGAAALLAGAGRDVDQPRAPVAFAAAAAPGQSS